MIFKSKNKEGNQFRFIRIWFFQKTRYWIFKQTCSFYGQKVSEWWCKSKDERYCW